MLAGFHLTSPHSVNTGSIFVSPRSNHTIQYTVESYATSSTKVPRDKDDELFIHRLPEFICAIPLNKFISPRGKKLLQNQLWYLFPSSFIFVALRMYSPLK